MNVHNIGKCVCNGCLLARTAVYTKLKETENPPIVAKVEQTINVEYSAALLMAAKDSAIPPSFKNADKKLSVALLRKEMRRLAKFHDYDSAKVACDALGCGKCSVEQCVFASSVVTCECPHCPFKVIKDEST